jgi:hypothetical protein
MNFLRNITFVDARKSHFPDLNLGSKNVSVLHLVADHKLRAYWENQIPTEVSAIEITSLINLYAVKFRKEFESNLDIFASKQTVFWNATRTAEKNTLINPFFLIILLLIILKDLNFQYEEKFIITDNDYLLNLKIHDSKFKYRVINNFKKYLYTLKLILQFTLLFFGNKLQSYFLPEANTDVVIHTFVDNESLSSLTYRERYFPGLLEWYENKGITVSHLISGAGLFPFKLYKSMLKNNLTVFNEYKLYGVRDFIFVISIFLKLRFTKIHNFTIDGEDFSNVSNDIHTEYGVDLGVLQALLRYKLGFRIKSQVDHPNLFITEYEGMILEKMLNLGIHASGVRIKVHGFQHGAMFEHLICNFPTEYELTLGIMPDKIICNGQKFSDLIIARGVPSEMVSIGSALRYRYLHENLQNVHDQKVNSIVVLLPMTHPDCVELINIFEDFSVEFNVEVHYKPHPFNQIALLLPLLKSPKNKFLIGSISDFIFNYKIIVGMTTGALLEAGLLGLCVVKIKRLFSLDFDTTFMNPELRFEVEEISDLSSVLFELLNRFPNKTSLDYKILLDSYFAPVNPDGMRSFLF